VAVLFVAGFGGVRHALLANLVLLVGMAWAFGYATLAVGHLNILSVAFTVTLIGIGIDYGVYYVSRYMRVRESTPDVAEALLETTRTVAPGIATGAITTAVAFFSAGFTDFTGIAELGIIAGGGVLLCAVAELFVLPAAILLVDGGRLGRRMPAPLPVQRWLAPLYSTPRRWLAVAVAATIFLAAGGEKLWYDNNLLNLQPVGLESVEWERKLLTESDQSSWYALSIADSPEELLARKERFATLSTVERTEEIVSLLPVDGAAKRPIIERIGARLRDLPVQPETIPLTPSADLDRMLAQAQQLSARLGDAADGGQALAQSRRSLAGLTAADSFQRQSRFQQELATDLLLRLRALAAMSDPEPPRWSDLPASLVDRFVGQHGRHLLKIYGRGNLWDTQALDRFVKEVRAVDPRATGNPLQAHEASLQMKLSFEQSALYALVVISVVLLIDFRNVSHAALAAMPLGVGLLQMFGIMGRMNIPLNPANMITLPLILGIAIDYGVHVVHDFREQRGRYLISSSTAVAVLVDGLTTLVGFGSLMIASHQGLQSLGRVLTIGVSCCLFSSLVLLPLLLTWLTWGRQLAEGAATSTVGEDLDSDVEPMADDAEPHVLDLRESTLVRRRRTDIDQRHEAA
jgi:hopanoid biosynthesis associated RND transporter like protein HpnN